MPGDTLAQLEGDGLAIRRRFPGFGQAGRGIAGGIQIHQRFLDFATHDVNAGGSLQAGVQDALFGWEMHRHDAPPARLFLREGGFRCDDIGGQSGGSQQQGPAVHFHRIHPLFHWSKAGLRFAGRRVNQRGIVRLNGLPFGLLREFLFVCGPALEEIFASSAGLAVNGAGGLPRGWVFTPRCRFFYRILRHCGS